MGVALQVRKKVNQKFVEALRLSQCLFLQMFVAVWAGRLADT